jgi:hypothetical protein
METVWAFSREAGAEKHHEYSMHVVRCRRRYRVREEETGMSGCPLSPSRAGRSSQETRCDGQLAIVLQGGELRCFDPPVWCLATVCEV